MRGDHNVISGFERPLPKEHRPIFSVDNLPAQRELLVHRSQGEGALVGKILVTAEHKLVDVVQNLRDVLKLESIMQIYRGVAGQDMKVPLHRQQYDRSAMTFFPLEDHILLVDAGE